MPSQRYGRRYHRRAPSEWWRPDIPPDPHVARVVAGIALFVPFVILLIGLPIALSVRGVLELISLAFRRRAAIAGQPSKGFLNQVVWTS